MSDCLISGQSQSIHYRYWQRSKPMLIKVAFPEDQIFNHVILDISDTLRETTLTISDSIETFSPSETEVVRVFSLCTIEITDIT